MKSLYVFFALFFTVLVACAVEKPVKVIGNIKGLGNNEVVLYTFDNKEMTRTKGVNDKFTLEHGLRSTFFYTFSFGCPARAFYENADHDAFYRFGSGGSDGIYK